MPPTTHPDLSELAKQIASLQAQFSEFIAASKSTNTTSTVTEGRKPPIFDASDANTIVQGSSPIMTKPTGKMPQDPTVIAPSNTLLKHTKEKPLAAVAVAYTDDSREMCLDEAEHVTTGGNPTPTPPSLSDLSKIKIGSHMYVYSPRDKEWYPCKVVGHQPNVGKHFYDLGYSDSKIEEGIDLSNEQFEFFGSAKATTSRIATTTKGNSIPVKHQSPLHDSDVFTLSDSEDEYKLNVGIVTTAKGKGTDSTGKFDLFLLFFISLYIYIHSHLIFF